MHFRVQNQLSEVVHARRFATPTSVIDKRRRSGVKCNVTERSRSAIYYSLMAPYVGLVVAESVGHPDHWSKRLQLNWGSYSLSW